MNFKLTTLSALLTICLGGFAQPCVISADTSSTPGFPAAGTIDGGETYTFCITNIQFATGGIASNWFHGVEIILGAGWDATTLTAISPISGIPGCDGSGEFLFVPTIAGTATTAPGSYTGGPGIWYDRTPLDGNPGNNFGDNSAPFCPVWDFCFEVTTLAGAACIPGADLSVSLNTTSDSETGSWSSAACVGDPIYTWAGPTLTCCDSVSVNFTDPLCAGEASGTITAIGTNPAASPFTFDLSSGASVTSADSAVFTGVPAGTWTITTTDAIGCISDQTVTLTDPPAIVLVEDSVRNVWCEDGDNGVIYTSATGGTGTITYSIDGGPFQADGEFDDLEMGSYTVTAMDSAGCTVDLLVTLIEENILAVSLDSAFDVTCFGYDDGAIQLSTSGGYPPYSYSIDGGASSQTSDFFGMLSEGSYSITVTDDDGCTVFIGVDIDEPDPLVVDAGTYVPIPNGGDVQLDPSTNATVVASWMWSPPAGLSCTDCPDPIAMPELSTWYTLEIVDENGCIALDSALVQVVIEVAIPNAFTPNGDGLNDLFIIRNPFLSQVDLAIYDRWGDAVFRTSDINIGWDGTKGGNPLEMGAYIYVLDAVTEEGEQITRTGTITLLR